MVGIGITTKDRPELLKALLFSIYKHTFMDNVKIYVADDTFDKLGIAKKKNECLRNLKDCDHVFLMDDDIEIINDGWIEFFVGYLKMKSFKHLLFLNESHNRRNKIENAVGLYNDCGGVFMALTKDCIEKVGAFNENFEKYGFEHAEYSQRIYKAGLTFSPYMCLTNTKDYLFAHDYSTANHKSSLTDEEKQVCIKNNWDKFFHEPIKSVYLPLD